MQFTITRLWSTCSLAIVLGWHSATSDRFELNLLISQTAKNFQQIERENTSLFKWKNAELVNILEAHKRPITLLRFSSDGRLLASVEPGAIAIWEVKTGKLQRLLPGHQAEARSMRLAATDIAFSPDGKFLATATWTQGDLTPQKTIVVWEVETGKEVSSFQAVQGCRQILFAPRGDLVYGACGLGVQIWQLGTGKKIFSFATHEPIEAIALTPDGRIMAAASTKPDESYQIRLWQLDKAQATPLDKVFEHENHIAQLAFTADNRRLVSSSYDGKIKVWNWQTELNSVPISLNSQSSEFSLNFKSNLIASNFPAGAIASVITGLPLETNINLPAKSSSRAIAFSPQEPVLAWAGKSLTNPNPVIFLWQAEGINSLSRSPLTLVRDDYVALDLKRFRGEKVETGVKGKNLATAVLAVLGMSEPTDSASETVTINYPEANLAVVTITQTNLADDSVYGIRYRIEFAPYGRVEDDRWRVIWAGEQYRCQANRGHTNWSKDLCQ